MHNMYALRWLKAGYVDKNVFHDSDLGTPQGGVISPLLANQRSLQEKPHYAHPFGHAYENSATQMDMDK
jgi:retron-type reverse transcriptase